MSLSDVVKNNYYQAGYNNGYKDGFASVSGSLASLGDGYSKQLEEKAHILDILVSVIEELKELNSEGDFSLKDLSDRAEALLREVPGREQ